MPIYRSKSNKNSTKSNNSGTSGTTETDPDTKDDESLDTTAKEAEDREEEPMTASIVKKFLFKNPKFLDTYVIDSVDVSTLRDWLENKDRTGQETPATNNCTTTDTSTDYYGGQTAYCGCECPNACLLRYFERGQQAGRYLGESSCCTCTLLPNGSKERRPYIIYAVDANDPTCPHHHFTVPRVMTNNEMGAFTRRYGFDLARRMNMY